MSAYTAVTGHGSPFPNDQIGHVEIPIARLKFGFQSHFEIGEVDEVPAQELPLPGVAIVLDSDKHVMSIVKDFVSLLSRSEIKGAQARIQRCTFGNKLRIEINDAI